MSDFVKKVEKLFSNGRREKSQLSFFCRVLQVVLPKNCLISVYIPCFLQKMKFFFANPAKMQKFFSLGY